jgi:hypothetical protein
MSSLQISAITFGCVFGGALLGLALRTVLPEHHLSADTKDAVKMGMGLIGTMAALVLGLLVASAKSSYDQQRNRALAHYGPETKEERDLLREVATRILDQTWSKGSTSNSRLVPPPAGGDVLYDKLLALSPRDDIQRSLKAQALTIAMAIGQARWLMYEQTVEPVSVPLLIVLILWLTTTFVSFGLFAPANLIVVVSFLASALAVSSAILLILEMYSPYRGLLHISSNTLRAAVVQLGR